MDDNRFKVISYQGILITNYGEMYYLLYNHPIDREEWMNDNERTFLGFVEKGIIQPITVSGYTLLPKRTGQAHVRKDFEELQEVELNEIQKITHELFQVPTK